MKCPTCGHRKVRPPGPPPGVTATQWEKMQAEERERRAEAEAREKRRLFERYGP